MLNEKELLEEKVNGAIQVFESGWDVVSGYSTVRKIAYLTQAHPIIVYDDLQEHIMEQADIHEKLKQQGYKDKQMDVISQYSDRDIMRIGQPYRDIWNYYTYHAMQQKRMEYDAKEE